MTLRSELMAIDLDTVRECFADVVVRQFRPETADDTEAVLARDYNALHTATTGVRLYCEEQGMSPCEAHLIAGGMVLTLALLKDIGERQEVDTRAVPFPPHPS